MNRLRLASATSAFAAFCLLASPVHAQATRTWVSGVGDDVNPCSRTAPCKTFSGAISKTAIGGEIDVLDPGGFGALTITKSITIDGTSGLAGVVVAGTNAFLVNAAGANVILRNLDINGAGSGIDGVRVLAAANVSIEKCKIYGFTQRGISDERTSGHLDVLDSVVSNNTQTGIILGPPSSSTLEATIQGVAMDNNGNAGFATTEGAHATIAHSVATGNTSYGFYADSIGGVSTITIQDSLSTDNGFGIFSGGGGTTIRLSNTTVTGNGTGISGPSILSYGNNHIDGNAGGNAPTGTVAPQ
jgi:hypothetical protein